MTEDPRTEEDALLCALMARVSQAETRALAELYDLTVARVYALARSITRTPAGGEAVTESVYWEVWRQAMRFDRRRGPVMAWLQALTRRLALAHGRPPGVAERELTLAGALARMEPLPRELLGLACQRGLSHEEIARRAGVPPGMVKAQLRRALAALRGR